MLIDARSVPAGAVVRGDLCIIGAGAAGISMARALRERPADRRPLEIVLLESGSFVPSRDTQALYRGQNVGRPYFPLDGCRVRTFGGSTQRWGGWCRSLDADDFDERDWVPESGWPLSRTDLTPHYRRARELCQLAVGEGEIDHGPPLPRRPRLPIHDPRVSTIVYQFSPPTRFGQAYRHELETASNIAVYLSANAVELEGGGDGPVTAVRVRTLTGAEFRVEARAFVLAAGGIENPRLLLASNGARPAGLGNEYDLVGRYFMEHLHVRLGCFVPARAGMNLSLYIEGRRSVRRPLGALTVGRAERHLRHLFGFSAALFPPTRRSVRHTLRHQARLRHPWGMHAASIARGGGLGFGLRVMDKVVRDARETGALSWHGVPVGPGRRVHEIMGRGEQTPLRDSRVTLSREQDRLGMPTAVLDWRVHPCDLASMTTSLGIIGDALRENGIGRVHLPDDPDAGWAERITGSWHHMGTTRMHESPRSGVVDADARVHSVPNVYVAGSSVFPTGGYANPTLTLLALSLRLADHLERELTAAIPLSRGRTTSPEPQSVSAD